MQTRYEQEIDLVDLLLDWLSHWRSLFICLLVGCVVGVGWYYVGAKSAAEAEAAASAQAEAEAAVQAEAEAAAQAEADAAVAAAEAATSAAEAESTKDTEYYESILSEAEKVEVDELVALYEAYQDAAEDYLGEDAKADDTSALSDLAVTRDAIATIETRLTDNQLAYYYLVLGYSTVAEVAEVAEVAIIKKSVLSCVIFAMLHFIFFALIYVFNGVQKHSENLGEVLGCADLVRLVDWTKGDALKGLDKAIYNAKMKNIECLSIEDAMQMNADTLAGLVEGDAKVAVIGKDTKAEALAFVDCAKKAHEPLRLEYLTGVSDSVANSRALADVSAVVLMVKIGCSKTAEVIEDYKKLQGRGVKVVGVCAVE